MLSRLLNEGVLLIVALRSIVCEACSFVLGLLSRTALVLDNAPPFSLSDLSEARVL